MGGVSQVAHPKSKVIGDAGGRTDPASFRGRQMRNFGSAGQCRGISSRRVDIEALPRESGILIKMVQ